ncbi:MAG: LbtU family siderophore porin [Desulfobulbaceae bacterium]|nr:LbtU family siderophore porin [Desulfobulbaceae bacterium]
MQTKRMSRLILAVFFGAAYLVVGGENRALAGSTQELTELKTGIEILQKRNQELSRRLQNMEEALAGQNTRLQAHEVKINAQKRSDADSDPDSDLLGRLGKHVQLSGLIEGDLVFSGNYADEDTSEITLSTVELGFDLLLADWANAFVLLKYEDGDDDENIFLDEAYMTLGKTEAFPAFVTLGKLVVPFGEYSTNMLQDPFTQTLGEINEGALVLGWHKYGVTASAFAYNGLDELDDDEEINGVGLALRYEHEQEEGLNWSLGAGWVNNIASADGIRDALPRTPADKPQLTDTVAGLNLHAKAAYGGFSALAEYSTALDSFAVDDLAFKDAGAQPASINGELAYGMEIVGHETVFALGIQKTWEALAMELPEFRYSASVAATLLEGLTLTFEYFHDEDYDTDDGGTGEDGYGFTTRLAYEF